jgi:hypothetical protein
LILAIPGGGGGSRILTSPFQSPVYDGLFIFYMISIISIVFGLLMGYVLGPVFLYIQKKFIGRKMVYAIVDKPHDKPFKRAIFKAFFPALLTLNISLILINNESIRFLVTGSIDPDITYLYTALIALFYIAAGIALGLFSPIWFLLDSGIVFMKKEDIGINPEILNIGRGYSNILKGYAGISVLLTFYLFIIEVASQPGVFNQPVDFISLVGVPLFPFVIAFYIIPAIIIIDATIERRKKYILKIASKMGIVKNINISINEVKKRDSME